MRSTSWLVSCGVVPALISHGFANASLWMDYHDGRPIEVPREGGFRGTVPEFGHKVLIKLAHDPASAARLAREWDMLRALDIQGIHNAFTYSSHPPGASIVKPMEPRWISLSSIIFTNLPIEENLFRRYVAQLLLIVHNLHSRNIAHGRIDSNNVIITDDHRVYLDDVGLATPGAGPTWGLQARSFEYRQSMDPVAHPDDAEFGMSIDYYSVAKIISYFYNLDSIRANRRIPFEIVHNGPADAQDLVQTLSLIHQETRWLICYTSFDEQIREHPYFAGIDWTSVRRPLPLQANPLYVDPSMRIPSYAAPLPSATGRESSTLLIPLLATGCIILVAFIVFIGVKLYGAK